MPDIISHYLFGLDTTKQIQDNAIYQAIKSNRNLFFIGCQGPDPMYYHKPYKKHNFSFIAARMHTEDTGYFLSSALCYVKKYRDTPAIYEPCLAYVAGLLCHYALDTSCHPYIFYLGGHYVADNPASHKYQGLHKQIELALDDLLLEETFGIHADHFKVHKHIVKPISLHESILKMYEELLFGIYAIPNGGAIFQSSYQDLRNYYRLTYDRLGFKKQLMLTAAPLVRHPLITDTQHFSYHHCVDAYTDYLNTAKHVWLHPVTGNVSTYSFKDLLRNAHKVSYRLLQNSEAFLNSDLSLEGLEAVLPNISYLTGLPSSDTRPMQYFKF